MRFGQITKINLRSFPDCYHVHQMMSLEFLKEFNLHLVMLPVRNTNNTLSRDTINTLT